MLVFFFFLILVISRNRAKGLLLERLVERKVFMEDNVACRNQFLQLQIVEAVLLGP